MDIHKLSDMHRGWFIGNFKPSVFRSKDFEIGVLSHKKGEHWPKHYHLIANEYNLLLSGSMTVMGKLIEVGDIFIIFAGEVSEPIFHEDCTVLCIKMPSVPGDKYEVR